LSISRQGERKWSENLPNRVQNASWSREQQPRPQVGQRAYCSSPRRHRQPRIMIGWTPPFQWQVKETSAKVWPELRNRDLNAILPIWLRKIRSSRIRMLIPPFLPGFHSALVSTGTPSDGNYHSRNRNEGMGESVIVPRPRITSRSSRPWGRGHLVTMCYPPQANAIHIH